MEFASTVVGGVIDFVLEVSFRQVAYIVCYRQNVEELNNRVKRIRGEKERVDHQRNEAENNLQNIEDKVNIWSEEVDEFETKVRMFWSDEGHTKTRLSKTNGLFPYLRNRHRLGRQAKKMVTEDVKKLIDDLPKFSEVGYVENVTCNDITLSNAGYVEFGSRKSTIEEIMAKLEDSTVRMIGLHGPGGVGKSTSIKEIAKQARDKKLFNVVVIVEITANPNPQKIQEEIAYVLGLRLEGEGENVRADCLRRRLKKEKENILIILDDLWDGLDLNKLGIPLDDDMYADEMSNFKPGFVEKQDEKDAMMSKKNNELGFSHDDDLCKITSNDDQDLNDKVVQKEKSLGDCKGCKILLTSRNKKVLTDKMDVKSIFCVKELDDKDALMLFQKVAGIPGKMSNSKQEIVKKYCAGIPMAIVTVGRALRDKSESVWQKTLDKLKNQELVEVQKSMEISVRMSYNHLENEELKSIFLLCAQMGHQPLIMDLVRYCFGLGILGGIYSLREARDRIYTSIQKLKDSSLMLDGSSSDHFSMHDMVRDAALSIAHDKNVFTLRNDKLDDWPELERCTSISICNSDIIDELPDVINCPQVRFFQIESDDPSLKIPDSFFEGMKKLRVLILTGIHLSSLPSSIKSLSNLRFLCLERCTLHGDLSIIGELKKLRILSFSGSQIENLQAELGCLDKLQLLDISNCSIVKMFPPNFISRLTSLEELYVRNSLIKMLVEGEKNQSQIAFLSELKLLHQLKVMDLCIPCATVLPRDLFFDELNDYKIVIGNFKMLSIGDFRMPSKYEAFRSLALQLKDDANIHFHKGIKLLFKGVQNLLLGELNDVQNVIYELNLDGFPYLKYLSITNNFSIKYIINSVDLSHPQHVFPNLESLCLYQLSNIEMICCGPVTNNSFTKLKTIKIKMCTHLKNLFSFYMVKFLASVETIDVSECDSLKEIVEIPANSDKVEFLKLHSLTLQSLPSFIGIYTRIEGPYVPQGTDVQTANRDHIEVTIVEDKAPLFGELVETPNLESLNLSSINIDKIWSDQPLSSVCFQNLIKLVVKDCYKLRYLCPLSVASGLKKLKGLFVSGCRKMEKIFETERNSAGKVCVFPKLEEIYLCEMNMLTDIWQAEASAADSFSSLISVHVERCEKLDKIFPSHKEGWFASVDSLKVVNCKSVEVIFEIKEFQLLDGSSGIDTNLQHIFVRGLPNLKQVWSTDPGRILNFKKLESIHVYYCEKLRNVFPASVAKAVQRLQTMLVHGCREIVEVVAYEDGSETNNQPLVFPELTYMVLYELPNIKHFSAARHHIQCPKLRRLVVDGCKKLQTFSAENSESTSEEENPIFPAEKVIPNLEYMYIGREEQNWLGRRVEQYRMHRLKEFGLRPVESAEFLYQFLYRMPNLEALYLNSSHSLQELVPSENITPQERLGTVLQLKKLIVWFSGIKDLGFERDPVLQRLQHLSLRGCDKFINLAPSSVSLTYLVYLEVVFCRGLINLMASTTAKSLVQLKTMKVIRSKVKEIVTNEGNEEDKVIKIVFTKLITLELVALEYLSSFCSYKNCEFKFPSLEILIVRECPMLETFTKSNLRAPKLQNILAVEGVEEAKWQWEGDVNTTIQKVFKDKVSFTHTRHINVSDNSNVESLNRWVWHCNHLMQQNNFHNLKSLDAYGCNSIVHVIPSHLLGYFENLEELQVRECKAAVVIFNISEITVTKAMGIIRLKKLTLAGLPKLEHVWDKDPKGIIGLQVLQNMSVNGCHCLKSLFPASVAKDLTRLEVLTVTNCKELVELFSKAAERENQMFVFSCLTSLTLKGLPGLKYFYPGLHTLEWPALEELHAFHCDLVILKCRQHHPEERLLIQIEKVIRIPSFKKLSFGIGNTTVTWDREPGLLRLDNLLIFEEEADNAPLYRLLDMLHSTIEKLEFVMCGFEKMFSAERPNADYTRILLHIKGLEFRYMQKLKSIGLEQSWLQPFSENLQTLKVENCPLLENLVTGTMSFSNLINLELQSCKRMLYLFTSSTAKSLTRLKEMKIISCDKLQEIVSTEGGEEIIFEQLQVLFLEELDELRWFYQGDSTLRFPSLEQVYIINCNRMRTFSPVNIIDNSIQWFSAKDATPQHQCDLNSAVLEALEKKFSESAQSVLDLDLADSPLLQELWLGVPIPNSCFANLSSLIVEDCQFLSDAVLPFNLLPFFTKLEKLRVENCDSVKTIFDVKCTQDTIMTFPMKKLTLRKLPKLENIWNEDPIGILNMQLLQKVSVENCKCLTSVFPASVAKDLVKLEKLAVEDCEELMTIVAEDNTEPRGANVELTLTCPSVRLLKLEDLPKLKYFYYCLPQGDIVKTFTHQEPHTEDQDHLEKPTSELWCLILGEKGLEMIKRGEFQSNLLHKLKVLTLWCHTETDVFPCEILQEVPSIEKLEVYEASFKNIFCSQIPNVCSGLKNSVPCTVSFSNMKYLEVEDCNSMLYLFSSSTVRSLAQLKRLEIKGCKSIQEIVSKEGNESHESEQIIFEQLQVLFLEGLDELKCFYPGNFTLRFPSLEQVYVIDCSLMETFSPVNIIDHSIQWFSAEDATPQQEADLNLVVRKNKLLESARSVTDLRLQDNPLLQDIWRDPVPIPNLCFRKLRSLTVEGCQFLSDAVLPFNLLSLLPQLETLEVENCDYVKTIFDVKCPTKDRILAFRLKKLTLTKLPNLENVWNEDPDGILSMQLLRQVSVENCKCLTSLFPASVAKGLLKLETLFVQHCEVLMTIIGAEEIVDPRGTNVKLTFPCVTTLVLCDLPKFEYNATTFELTPNLEALALGENEVEMIQRGEFQGNLPSKLKLFGLLNFHVESDVFPFKLLQQVPNIEKFMVGESSFKEIFCFQSPNVEDVTGILSRLKKLYLESLPELVSIGLESSWIEPFIRNLETLKVESCSRLRNLAPSPVCFSNLMRLTVSECHGLVNLFTCSTAKSLAQLRIMKIKCCDSIEEIVFNEGGESHENEIIFQQLNCLKLKELSKLRSFYKGSLSFPSLEELSIIDCNKVETLCPGTVKADKLFGVKFNKNSDAIPLEVDLNSTLHKAFLARAETALLPLEDIGGKEI